MNNSAEQNNASDKERELLSLTYLRELAKVYPSVDSALAKMAVLSSTLTLPKGSVHVISDVHGEYKKLRHVVNNASGNLRHLVQKILGERLSEADQLQLLSFIYYPRESYLHFVRNGADPARRRELVTHIVAAELEIVRDLASRYPLDSVASILPAQYIQVFRELILGPQFDRSQVHFTALVNTFIDHNRDLELLRLTARVVRNLSISELVVAGDLGDRGARIDKSIEFISRQPNVSITWGNHDVTWMGACLGHEASIATVIRLSLRYGRIAQLEEGYGIPLEPLERLANGVYQNDPCTHFSCKDAGGRDPALLARMQKAIAVIQFKLEGQVIARNPQYGIADRDLLSKVTISEGTVTLGGKVYPLRDKNLPTFSQTDPLQLSPEEAEVMNALRQTFLASPTLWVHMRYLAKKGHMALLRDYALIFHGCIPVKEDGEFLPLQINGLPLRGKALFDAIEVCVQRAFQSKLAHDLDLLWYLWCGPLSPLFGKDKIATFEMYFIEDKETHHEEKNPYFKLIHERWFCERVLQEFGVTSPDGLIVNGHVPVKIDKGESPVKRSGMAVTIDGAFSEAYGDKGYTLVLESERSYLALHKHFESVDDSILNGTDMVPVISDLKVHEERRLVRDTEQGTQIRDQIALLELLITAYQENRVSEVRSLVEIAQLIGSISRKPCSSGA